MGGGATMRVVEGATQYDQPASAVLISLTER